MPQSAATQPAAQVALVTSVHGACPFAVSNVCVCMCMCMCMGAYACVCVRPTHSLTHSLTLTLAVFGAHLHSFMPPPLCPRPFFLMVDCSKECQLKHYVEHKAICKKIAQRFCLVSKPTFIGYNDTDPEEQAISQTLRDQSHEPCCADGSRFFPLLFPQQDPAGPCQHTTRPHPGARESVCMRENVCVCVRV